MTVESLIQGNLEWNIITLGIALLVVVVLAVKMIGMFKSYKFYHDLPGSSDRSFLYGHLHKLGASGESRLKFGRSRMLEGNGRYSCFWISPFKPAIVVYHPELAKKIFASSAPKARNFGSAYSLAMPWIGEGLIVANGQRWARSRRLLTPAFHFDILKDYMLIYNQAADKLITKLDKFAETGESFDICPLVTLCTLEVILRCALGFGDDIQGKGHMYAQATRELTELWAKRARKPWLWPDFLFYLSAEGKTFYKHCNYVHKVAEDIIEKRKEELSKGNTNKGRHLDFIDILLSARDEEGKPMTTKEIRNEVDTFMFAGHDTTASSIPWILYTLAEHKEYQERIQEEIDNIVEGRDTSDILWQDLSKLETLSLCTKEAMRIYPPVPFIQRQLEVDFDLDGVKVPAGSTINIAILHIHQNPQVWDEPLEFRPERFQVENKSSMDSFAFIPFSAGSRNCIGQNFALNEEKVLLSRILQRYSVSVAPEIKPQRLASVVLRCENGLHLKLKRR